VFRDATSLHTALRHLLTLSEVAPDVTLTHRLAQRSSPRLACLGDKNPVVYDIADIWQVNAWPHLGFEFHEPPPAPGSDPLRDRLAFQHRDLLTLNTAIAALTSDRAPHAADRLP
jgi:hypothetical protein